ncbi:TPA: DNA cytosine methyltransferase [Escherichia coli]|nr:DNA cytosine methyltransferase [Escherichia coli]HCO8674781.1 DNA cytosine methyltransferase [Escherichia coli]
MKNKYSLNQLSKKLSDWQWESKQQNNAGIQVLDLFCGAGGMSSGFATIANETGFYRMIGGVDINPVSIKSYEKNINAPGIEADVFKISENKLATMEFLKSIPNYNPSQPLVLIGCAPCQGFSAHRKKNWDTPDHRNGLVECFADIANFIEPECIIMENVPELLSGRYWHHFEYFRDKLQEKGYIVKQSIHNAATFGVPQERFRAIVIAMKSDFNLPEGKLNRENFKTVKDAIGQLPPVSAGENNVFDKMHKSASHRKSTIEVIKQIPLDGGSRPAGVGPKCLQNFKGFADVYGRLYWNKPSITITHYARNPASGRFVHPEQHRGLTAREAARLQSFPDNYEFCGGFDDIFRQIGEAVPPLMSLNIAFETMKNLNGDVSVLQQDLVHSPVNDSYAGIIAGIKGGRI